MMLKQTKIVASISDQRCEVEFIRDLFKAGMNVVRMNTAHASREGFEKLITNVREVSNRIAILMDTKGPEVRTTAIAGGEPIPYQIGDKVKIVGNPAQETTRECIAVSYPGFVHDLQVDGDILIDDGDLELRVIEKTDEYLLCEVQNEATLGNRKSVNVPGVRINLPSLTEKDRNNILYAIEKDIDFIAHSFVRNKQDVLDIRQILDAYGSDIKIIAKIENQEGVDNIDEILEVADGVMVARGDLGIEVPQERIPGIQRLLIKKCILAKKPVIVATQMLHTMINNPRPTRAEVTDIANAIYYRTDALMLSGETAYGKYPVEAVKTMAKIADKDKGVRNVTLKTGDQVIPHEGDSLNVFYPHPTKWGAYDETDDFGYAVVKDWPVMRLGETYLLRAEARFRQGNTQGAADDINVLRDRAFKDYRAVAPGAGKVTADQIDIDFILDERARELISEENRRMTLVRTNTLAERIKLNGDVEPAAPSNKVITGFDANIHTLLPIPLTEIQLNKDGDLKQNPGY